MERENKVKFITMKEANDDKHKYFTYESSEEDDDEICCCKSLPPQQPCPEIEEYLKSISD